MTQTEIENNKETFKKIFTEDITREGASNLLEYLLKTDFFTAPASTKFHLAEEGGLCVHTLHVYERLHKLLRDNYGENYLEKFSRETIAIVSLLHDICKIHIYKKDFRNVKVDGQWVREPIYIVEERLHFGHGSKSVFMVQQFMKLFVDEAVAIRYHMGGLEYVTSNFVEPFVAEVYNDNSLALLLHIADMEATYLDERQNND